MAKRVPVSGDRLRAARRFDERERGGQEGYVRGALGSDSCAAPSRLLGEKTGAGSGLNQAEGT